MDSKDILQDLNRELEIDPDAHDGSYELMMNIISSYSKLNDYSMVDYLDLNAVYAMAIGTFKLNVEKKKDYVNASHLPDSEKDHMAEVIDRIWDNACHSKYENRVKNKPTIGMFGTGFYTFKGNADQNSCQRFIKMMVDILGMSDDDKVYDRVESVFDNNFKGMQAAAASIMLHCLKPFTFPILNSNFGSGTIYERLGITLDHPNKLVTYIDNCRRIKTFRDANIIPKNFRVMDCFARKIDDESLKFLPSLDEYDPGFTREQWYEIINDPQCIGPVWGRILSMFYLERDGASCTYLSNKYGDEAQSISGCVSAMTKNLHKVTDCPVYNGNEYWLIMFQYRETNKNESGSNIWRLRSELYDAITDSDILKYLESDSQAINGEETPKMPLNTILYGPPGTGKTFNAVIYAVSIIENKSLKAVRAEAVIDYKSVKARYDNYFSKGQIAFTTFHQSYGYEEFIEGIRPIMSEEENDVGYRIESGVFKEFCDRALIPTVLNDNDYGLNKEPKVWKVSLGGARDNPVRTDCLENDHIRIGWDEYGPDISDRFDELSSGKRVLNAFLNVMSIGDIVLSCYSSTEIDAIGVVTGDYEWNDSYGSYMRIRKVKWLVKDIRENIIEINHGSHMTLATVYWIGISIRDVLNIVEKYQPQTAKHADGNKRKFVFIIDEINRGNISKIFGELITLIEESKRIGAPEAINIELPYSHSVFGIPDNVYILGTMNTADRSIAIMDTALRRRFSFVEMLPDSDVLRKFGDPTVFDDGISVNISDMLDVINERITFLYDREHTIGHAFFIPLVKNPSIDKLAEIFENSIIPLLQEYFYEDYAKIQLVLGDDGKIGDKKPYQFIKDEDIFANDIFETVQELDSEKKYTINYSAFCEIKSYKYISKKL